MLIVMWDEVETVKLIDSYWKIERNKSLKDSEIRRLSELFRKYGKDRGYPVDVKYRNTNGIGLQLEAIRGIYTANRKGIQKGSKLFREMVQLRETDREAFDRKLQEANRILWGYAKPLPSNEPASPKKAVSQNGSAPSREPIPVKEPVPEEHQAPIAEKTAAEKDPAHDPDVAKFMAFIAKRGYQYARSYVLGQMDIVSRFCGLSQGMLKVTDIGVISAARRKLETAGFISRYGAKQAALTRDLVDLYRTFLESENEQPPEGQPAETEHHAKSSVQENAPTKTEKPEMRPSASTQELSAFAVWMENKLRFNRKLVDLYCSILTDCVQFIETKGLKLPLLQATPMEVQETMDALRRRYDFEELNRKAGNRCGAALARYAKFREDVSRGVAPEPMLPGKNPQQNAKTGGGSVKVETPKEVAKEVAAEESTTEIPAAKSPDERPAEERVEEPPKPETSDEVTDTDGPTGTAPETEPRPEEIPPVDATGDAAAHNASEQNGEPEDPISIMGERELLHAFKQWAVQECNYAVRSAQSYSSAIRMSAVYIRENDLPLKLYGADEEEAKRTAEQLMSRPDYSQRDQAQRRRYSSALRLFARYCANHKVLVRTEDTESSKGVKENQDPKKEESQAPIPPEKMSPWESYEQVLKSGFSNGVRKNSGMALRKLRRTWEQQFGEVLEDEDAAICYQLAEHCVDTGEHWYLEEHLITPDELDLVCQHIDDLFASGKSVVYYSSLYHAVEQDISNPILTEKQFTKCLQAACRDRYCFADEYISKDPTAVADVAAEIRELLLSAGKAIPADKIKAALSHLPPERVAQTLASRKEFIDDASNGYILESAVDLLPEDLNHVADVIQAELDETGFLVAPRLRRLLREVYPEITNSLDYLSDLGFRRVIALKLQERFQFGETVITPLGSAMDMSDVFAMFCRRRKSFSLEELDELIRDSAVPVIYWPVIHANCVRVSMDQFVSLDAVKWDIEHTDAAIELFCPGDYIALSDVYDFSAFPYVGTQWNIYLLEHYVAAVSKKFTLMHSSYAKYGAYGAIVRRDADLAEFDDVLADVLAKTDAPLEKKACLAFLTEHGYIAKKKLSKMDEILSKAKIVRAEGK